MISTHPTCSDWASVSIGRKIASRALSRSARVTRPVSLSADPDLAGAGRRVVGAGHPTSSASNRSARVRR
jgi:hypothetical protein